MKPTLSIPFPVRLLLIALLLPSAHAASIPDVEITYDERADGQCSRNVGRAVRPEWVSELQSRLPEFRAIWQSVGPSMSQAVSELTNKPFAPNDAVKLTLCDVPSNSIFGPTVNMRYALQSFSKEPVPLRYKVDTVFHELLRGFVAHNVPGNSRLLSEHGSESSCVRNHLHLLALQKAVLLELKDKRALEQVIAIDSQLPSGCYKRAWTLVNATEGTYKQFVAELAQ